MDAYSEGMKAKFRAWTDKVKNPYQKGTEDWVLFEIGVREASEEIAAEQRRIERYHDC